MLKGKDAIKKIIQSENWSDLQRVMDLEYVPSDANNTDFKEMDADEFGKHAGNKNELYAFLTSTE